MERATPQERFWFDTVNSWKPKAKNERMRLEKIAAAYRSRYWNTQGPTADKDDTAVETNMFYAFADTLIAQVVPLNPAVTVVANRDRLKEAAALREQLINVTFKKERFTDKLWKTATRATVWPRGWLKAVWSKKRKRPIFRVINPHYVWCDVTAEDYEDVRYIIEVTPLSRADFEERMKKVGRKGGHYRSDALERDGGVSFGKWPDWLQPDEEVRSDDGELDQPDIVRGEYEWTVIYEVYDFRGGKFYHFADGCERPLYVGTLPYSYLPNPYFMLVFNDNLNDLGGMSDADLIYPLVERQNEMDSLEMWHTRTAIPATVVHQGLVDDPDAFMDAYEEIDGPGQVLMLNAKPGVGIGQVIGSTPVVQLPIEWGRVQSRLEKNIEFTLGMPSYARGEVGQSDVATELALSDTATRTRNARRQKVVYHAISWAASAVISLYQEFMPPNEEIPLRVAADQPEEMVGRKALALSDDVEDPWAFDYEVHPYSAEEANSTVQLKNLATFLPFYMQGVQLGVVDVKTLYELVADLHRWPQLIKKDATPGPMPPQPGQPPGGAPGMAGGAGMPPEMAAMAGGQVPVGAGDQAVPFGLEGGAQPGAPMNSNLGGMAPFQK